MLREKNKKILYAASYAFVVENGKNIGWNANAPYTTFTTTGKFQVGVAAGSANFDENNNTYSGFGSGSFDLRTSDEFPIDGVLGILALAGLLFGFSKSRK